ncbi:uncharacterized protein LOC116421000 [Sarcophilus harrisii]|uniref:uncharacterized protein LOC116421000 n=1 Tax=Sarcophilus harrisii TaxID=9305 RepID=UPI001301E65B|nr:uncharacterized protein LOC116421000 [Sarcophilus harrisii]
MKHKNHQGEAETGRLLRLRSHRWFLGGRDFRFRTQPRAASEKPTRGKGVQKTCPSKTYVRIQYEAQKSSLLKNEEKGRALQSTSHTPNTFDFLDTLLTKLNEEKNEPSHNQRIGFDGRIQYEAQKSSLLKDEKKGRALQSTSHIPSTFDVLGTLLTKLNEEKNEPSYNQGIGLIMFSDSQIQGASEKCVTKQVYNNSTAKNQEHSEFQIPNHLLDPMTNQYHHLTEFSDAKKQVQNGVIGNSRLLPLSLDPHLSLIPMDSIWKIDGKNLVNFH